MKYVLKHLIVGAFVGLEWPAPARPADPDWKAVEPALGKAGQLQPGDVFRIGMPRTDLAVTVKGVPVKAGFALGSYAAFKQVGDQAMVMGDLVLLDEEVPAVMSGLFAGGLEVTAVHNHLNEMSPHVMYMHYGVTATPSSWRRRSARRCRRAGRRWAASGPAAAPPRAVRTRHQADRAGPRALRRDIGAGVFQVTVPVPNPSPRWVCPCCPPWA